MARPPTAPPTDSVPSTLRGMTDEYRDDSDDASVLADGLRDAFARLASVQLDGDQKAVWQRRLIAIADASKHDVTSARKRLDVWRRELGALARG